MVGNFFHNCIKGFACLAIALLAMANKPCFADDRLLIGSFNSFDDPVQLVVANPNSPMSSVLATAANQTFSSHSDDSRYNYLSGPQFLDYISYCGLDFLSSHSAKWFYDNDFFVNYYGRFDDTFIWLSFVFCKSNFVNQPLEWKTVSVSGEQVFYDNCSYFVPVTGSFFFSPCVDNAVYNNVSQLYSSLQYFSLFNDRNNGFSADLFSFNNSSTSRHLPCFASSLSSSSFNFYDTIDTFFTTSTDYDFLCLTFRFSLSDYNNSIFPSYVIGHNFSWMAHAFVPLASSFYDYAFNTEDYFIYSYRGVDHSQFQFQKYSDSLAVSFPFLLSSGALAYESDLGIVPDEPTLTPMPSPTSIPPWRDSELPTPTAYPSVTVAPLPTGIVTDYIPLLDLPSSESIVSNITGIIKEFNSIFSRKVFALGSYTLQVMYYFSGWFKFIFIVPAGVFIAFLIGRLRKK